MAIFPFLHELGLFISLSTAALIIAFIFFPLFPS